ncbi:MAG TPA: hypothetical protein VFH82_06735 [Gemmatimonadota bacterium]|nr:hypothetical protein [Gemmatimonadota bacterium]
MKGRFSWFPCLVLALVLGACSEDDPTSPESFDSGAPMPSANALQLGQQETPDPNAVARAVPGFAGYFLDEAQRPTVYLKDVKQRAAAELALAGWLSSRGFTGASLQVRQARYDWLQLHAWYARAWPAALSVAGAVFSDVDEGSNRLRFGGTNLAGLTSAIVAAGVPADAFVVELASPIALRSTLQDRVRPVPGGYQINFLNVAGVVGPTSLLCTLGFNAIPEGSLNAKPSYVTNSHCTGVSADAALIPMDHYQPLQDVNEDNMADPENFIGSQVDDPSTTITLDCVSVLDDPVVRVPGPCRWSDASRGEYADGVPFQLGRIARTRAFDPVQGTLEVDPSKPTFQIIGEQPFPVLGETVNKVGRTTGWTGGKVTGTCVDIITDDHFIRRCQAQVAAGSAGGDSGSPVFAAPNRKSNPNGRVVLVGILWGGSIDGEPQFVYSPMNNVERELGPLKTF